ncbi:rod shape-determining protein MreC [Polaribacter uvawellassae]|uniref:rod shape-determining protein MreC n=1 Tax=Polaribacter uvawellassae TaxID=3133495 RepID=UPI00321BABC0
MQQLFYFFRKYKYFLFFLLLGFISIFFTINNNNFHKSKFISSANEITGGLYDKTSQISNYFNLKHQNEELILENNNLKNLVEKYTSIADSLAIINIVDSTKYHQKYSYTTAKINRNNYHNQNNILLINKGRNQGVYKEMAVVNSKGIIGITDDVSANYARVQSILNSNSKINAKLKNSFHFGTLIWDGQDYNIVQLEDIPRQADIKVGDTIITGGKSTIFPEGILIGTIQKINSQSNNNSIDIKLFNDMSNIGNVYVVTALDKEEIRTLINLSDE